MNRRLWFRVKSARMLLGLTVGLGFLSGTMIILQAVYLARIITEVFLGGQNLRDVLPAMLGLLLLIGMRGVVNAVSEITAMQMAIRIKTMIRRQLIRHLFALGPAYVRRERGGELVNTAFAGIEQLETYLALYLPQVSLSILIPLAILCFVGTKDWLTALIFVITAPLIPFFMILIGKSAKSRTNRQWRTLGVLSAHFLDVLRGLTTLKLFNRSKAQIGIIGRISDEYRKTTMGTLRVAFLSALFLEFLTTLSTAVVAVALGLRLLSGAVDFHRAFLVLLLAPEFYLPIRLLGTQFHAGMNGVSAANRIFDILDTEPLGLVETESGIRLERTRASSPGFHVMFEDVDFTYPGADVPALSKVSFSIEPGQTVAIVGPSGAGKSTLFDLLLGFLKPDKGRILVDGVPLGALSLAWWREQITFVPQRTHLFHGSVINNLRLANANATFEQVVKATRQAQADGFIRDLPQAYDTKLGEDVRLSGGQVQRVAIAQAFLKDSPFVLMDEPTAQLDIETEWALQGGLKQLFESKSAVIVAHRLATVLRADKIIVMNDGHIVQQGRHDALISEDGLYKRLFAAYQGEQRISEAILQPEPLKAPLRGVNAG